MITKCLFPVAGYGTRFLPATKAMPKEMLPILNKPLIQYGVEEALAAGMHAVTFVTGRGKRAIEDHFDLNYELEREIRGTEREASLADIRRLIANCTFSYTRQITISGLGHAIATAETLIGDQPFAVVLADDLCVTNGPGVLSQMMSVFDRYSCSIVAIEQVPREQTQRYGIVAGENIEDRCLRVRTMVEKPRPADAQSDFAVIGRYILTPDIFEILRHTPPGASGEVQITDALSMQAAAGRVVAYRFEGRRFDCGSIDGFVEATNYFYRKLRGLPNAGDGGDAR